MDSLNKIKEAVNSCNHAALKEIFSPTSTTWHSLGSGEQKTLSANFINAALACPAYLSNVFDIEADNDASSPSLEAMKVALQNLPPSLENGGDNILREKLFEYFVELQEFREAAHILAGYRMDDGQGQGVGDGDAAIMDDGGGNGDNPYYTSPAKRTDIYVRIAECFLHEDDIVEADTFVTKAGAAVEILTFQQNQNNDASAASSADDNDDSKNADADNTASENIALILRYKSTYARVLDANRKFLQAASRYYDLSAIGNQLQQQQTDEVSINVDMSSLIDSDDLIEFLGRAATCAILAPSSNQRQRMLGMVYKDERLSQLDSIDHFQTHSSILSKMYKEEVIRRDRDLERFEGSLADHQRAVMSDGLTIVQRALMEHNMVAVSRLYSTIYFKALGTLLGLSEERAQKVAAKMILDGSLMASIDEVEGVLVFVTDGEGNTGAGSGAGDMHGPERLLEWDGAITSFCMQLNSLTDVVRQNA